MKKDKKKSAIKIKEDALKELRYYRKAFLRADERQWAIECQRATYVLSNVLGISWDAQRDKVLGYPALAATLENNHK